MAWYLPDFNAKAISGLPLPPSDEMPNQRSMKSIPPPAVLYLGSAEMANSFDKLNLRSYRRRRGKKEDRQARSQKVSSIR
jgi:hypothetical protein